MADEKKMELAQKVYQTLCDALDSRNWRYMNDDDKLLVHFGVNGDDIPMKFIIVVDADRQLVRLMSPLSFKMSESKRIEGAIATTVASYGMNDGSFDYDMSEGEIVYRLTQCFRDSTIGMGLFHYMIDYSCAVVDAYNEKFLALEKGLMSLQDFIAKE